jgi:hypothetical protein
MKSLGMVISPAWLAVLVRHAGWQVADLVQHLWAIGASGSSEGEDKRPRCTASQTTGTGLQ